MRGAPAPVRPGWLPGQRFALGAIAALLLVLGACSRDGTTPGETAGESGEAAGRPAAPIVTASPDQQVEPVPQWQAPKVEVDGDDVEQLKEQAAAALEAGELFGDDAAAIPLYLALREHAPDDPAVAAGLERAVGTLVEQGGTALAAIDEDPGALQRAREIAAVARAAAPERDAVVSLLERVDLAVGAQQANARGERELNERRFGLDGGGAVASFNRALELRPGDARALQGLAATESALIRQAELAARRDDYSAAGEWLDRAARVRPGMETVADARLRIARQRGARVGQLRDMGIAALTREGGIEEARKHLADLLEIAPAGDPAGEELRERIELATHYGLFRPGQAFTESLGRGSRGPEMVVIPHGSFRMGAAPDEPDSTDAERPARSIRFDRGLAVSRNEITVGEFRRFVTSTGYEPRATRRGYSTVYDERSGNLVRRSGVDWQSDYSGQPAEDGMPVVHVSAHDAAAYAQWLSEQTGHEYRLPSEAEFEYMLRAGNPARFPWGDGAPPAGTGNFTGGGDESPSGRRWRNAFKGYDDGAWGPAPAGSYRPNAFGLHDVAGNVSEWVADCWHDGYRRAPADGQAWFNPGCRTRVVRGGSWASSPAQTRSAWRLGSDANTTNARVGFRVVREI
jgi:formylglycine-generating enzyme required for sulfatase activity